MEEHEKWHRDKLVSVGKNPPWSKDYVPQYKEGFADKLIFRIEHFRDFLANINSNQLFFRHPSEWEDPYDSVFVRSRIQFPDGLLAIQDYAKDYFCQCWSSEHTERMWRQYSKDAKSVMLVSTVGKIMNEIWKDDAHCFVGKVMYFPLEEIKKDNFFESIFGHYGNIICSHGIAQTFLLKDDSYQYEEEVRFIVWEKGGCGRDSIVVNCKLQNIIKKVIVDPRADNTFFEMVQGTLKQFNLDVQRADEWYKFPMTYKFTKKKV
jgi:Protein of unknown function (DUF2971).